MIPARMAVEEDELGGLEAGNLLGGLEGEVVFTKLAVELGGLVGSLLLGGLDGDEHGLEAVTKDEAGTQGSACLKIDHIWF